MTAHPSLQRPHHPPLVRLRFGPRRRAHRVAVLAAVLAAAAATTTWQLWPQTQAPAPTTAPAWFQPIADYYHNNPAITPQFDFASLYAGYPPWFERIAAYYGYNPAITPEFDFASLYSGHRASFRAPDVPAGKYGPLDPWAYTVIYAQATPAERYDALDPSARNVIREATPAGAFISEHSFGQNGNGRSAAGVVVARPALIADSGFDWRDAGIGAAVALGLALLALATMLTLRRRHTIAHIPS